MAALFELFATLGLDTKEFDADVKAAQKEAKQLESDIEAVDNAKIDFDKQRKEVERDFKQMENAVEDLGDELRSVGRDAKELDKLSKSADVSGTAMAMLSGTTSGLISAGAELVQEAIQWMVEFAGKSLEYVAESGSAIGEELKKSNKEWEYTEKVMMTRVGEALAPLTIAVRQLADELLGVTVSDKLRIAFDELEKYRKEKLVAVRDTLRDIVGLFDEITVDSEDMPTLDNMVAGLRSQDEYWSEYTARLEQLSLMGYDPRLLGELATGGVDSMQQMRALATASATEVAEINSLYDDVAKARDAAAEGITDAQMVVDETAKAIVDGIEGMLDMDEGQFRNEGYMVVEAIANGMEAASPYLQQVCQEILGIGAQLNNFGAGAGGGNAILTVDEILSGMRGKRQGIPKANGLNYVPYNDYPSRLHVGEAVLTRQQAEQWRAGQGNSFDMEAFAEMLTANLSASLASVSVAMDGRTVGRLVSGTVSREIGRNAGRRLNRT